MARGLFRDLSAAVALFYGFMILHEYAHLTHSYLTIGKLPNGWRIKGSLISRDVAVSLITSTNMEVNALVAVFGAAVPALLLGAWLARRGRWYVAFGPLWYYVAVTAAVLRLNWQDARLMHEAWGYAPAVALIAVGILVVIRHHRPRVSEHSKSSPDDQPV